ncbi:MAG: ABC transporter substrate-binding protein [Mobilicoccus sp.]|nr:ABC transporter substrate-binding protein [Mobilicoccus sp.]
MRRTALALLASPLFVLAACGAPTDGGGADPAEPEADATTPVASCDRDALETMTEGTLTIGTDNPAYEPWFVDNDPSNGEGFESAVAYAIAERMGFAQDEVTWVDVPFNNAVAPGPKNFDFDVNQISISDERRQAVDFSSGYYDVRQVVITTEGSAIADAGSVADLENARLGAQVGTTSYTAITDLVQPSQQPNAFDTNDLAVQALQNGQIDGIVVDLPTAFYMTAAQLENGTIVGQLPEVGGQAEQFGAVLDLNSPLTACVTEAVDALREDGTLDDLERQWLSDQGAPELQ